MNGLSDRLLVRRHGKRGRGLAVAAAALPSQAAGAVESALLALRAEEAAVAQLSQYAGALHPRLEPLEQGLRVFSIAEHYVRQNSLLGPCDSMERV